MYKNIHTLFSCQNRLNFFLSFRIIVRRHNTSIKGQHVGLIELEFDEVVHRCLCCIVFETGASVGRKRLAISIFVLTFVIRTSRHWAATRRTVGHK